MQSNLAALLMAGAIARAQMEADIEALELEISPQTSTLLLSDYEAVLGPDAYGRDIGALTTAQLQALLFSRWIARGGQSISYYVALGAAMGVTLSIYEPDPAVYGDFVYGDGSVYSDPRIDLFTWVVTLPSPGTDLEPMITANRQPDTQVVFVYVGGTGFGSYDFSSIAFGS
ncbi:hypothetical protein Amme_099_004 [Acidomonas methanolica NBRC 104435]|uniref:Uncharacterized protein n=2 Tax=Acidomonas methanolica TaxID=437 RepID=A0A023D7E0_ACIMT|nr:hypothetical protein Amme_099_004 [Acidomonas methanolica NBRC 104435]GEK97852.1 hypothetical protein AME01nite_03510 [Acidomonas methanolica NBRC 104435]